MLLIYMTILKIYIIVNSYNKIVLLQRKDNIFIPIIDDSLTNVHILQQKQFPL